MSDAKHYAIQYRDNPSEWWSESLLWSEKPTRDIFTEEERKAFELPVGGEWVEVDPDEEVTPYDDEFPDEHSHEPENLGIESSNQHAHLGVFAMDDEGRHYYLVMRITNEAINIEVQDRYGEEVLATFDRTFDELVDFVFANEPTGE